MSFSRLSGIAALGVLAIVASGCASDEPVAVGIDSLRLATLGSVNPSQQAFIDRMNELSEGTVDLQVTENWTGGEGDPEVAITKAVLAGEVDIAWVTVRSLSAIGVDGLDAVEAPLVIQTHDQQRAVALGVPGEMITNSLKKTNVAALALIPGPQQHPVASGAPIIDIADWAGKSVQVSSLNPIEQLTVETLGGTASLDGPSTVADVVGGSAQVTVADPVEMLPSGSTKDGPFMTSNISLWPKMYVILVNRDIIDRLSNRQHGFLDGSVVRAQDTAMADPDLSTIITDTCKEKIKFGVSSADQLAALLEAVQPVYDKLNADPTDARLLEAIQDVVKRNAGTGAFTVSKSCRWTEPK